MVNGYFLKPLADVEKSIYLHYMNDKQSNTRSIRIDKKVYLDVKLHVAASEESIKDFIEYCIRKVLPSKK